MSRRARKVVEAKPAQPDRLECSEGLSDSAHSSFRETVLEHRILGELLRRLWLTGTHAELLRPSVDDAGYDAVIVANGVTRHIQFKASYSGAKTSRQCVGLALSRKPSGCVIWMVFDQDTLEFTHFRWFGGAPGEPLPDIEHLRVAKSTRGDSSGAKPERVRMRVVPRSQFVVVDTVSALVDRLFDVADDPDVDAPGPRNAKSASPRA